MASLPQWFTGRRLRAGSPALLPVLLLAALLGPGAALAQAPQPPPRPAPPPSFAFGDKVAVRNCLRFQVFDYRNHQADVENHDWVRLRVENACPSTIRYLLVELMLLDTQGGRYGTPIWVLGRGEQLIPGAHWEDDVAIPDPDSRVALRWSMRVLRADGLPRPPPPKPATPQ